MYSVNKYRHNQYMHDIPHYPVCWRGMLALDCLRYALAKPLLNKITNESKFIFCMHSRGSEHFSLKKKLFKPDFH
jgi:hypothetical protein